jgi:hypothetical protein
MLTEEMLARKYLWEPEEKAFRNESKRRDYLSEIRVLLESDVVKKKLHK